MKIVIAGGHGRVLVRAGAHVDDGEISRDDVAALLAFCLDDAELAGVDGGDSTFFKLVHR